MRTPDTTRKLTGARVCGGIMLAALAGCEPIAIGYSQNGAPPAAGPGPTGAAIVGSTDAIGGIRLFADGRFVVVDAAGNAVELCRLPSADEQPHAAADPRTSAVTAAKVKAEAVQSETAYLRECAKRRSTTLTNMRSVAVARHTGSQCMRIPAGQTVSGGQFIPGNTVYELCW